MTFLEFTIEDTLGPPEYRRNGQSFWYCPTHQTDQSGTPKLYTLPVKPGFKDRYMCWVCDAKAHDAADFLLMMFPSESWPQRADRLYKLWAEFKSLMGERADEPDHNTHRGRGASRAAVARALKDVTDYYESWSDEDIEHAESFDSNFRYRLADAVYIEFLSACIRHDVSPKDLNKAVANYRIERRHSKRARQSKRAASRRANDPEAWTGIANHLAWLRTEEADAYLYAVAEKAADDVTREAPDNGKELYVR